MTATTDDNPVSQPDGAAAILSRLLEASGCPARASEITEAWIAAADVGNDRDRLLQAAGSLGLEAASHRLRRRALAAEEVPFLVVGREKAAPALVTRIDGDAAEVLDLDGAAPRTMSLETLALWAAPEAFRFHPAEPNAGSADNPSERLKTLNPLRNIGMWRLGWVLVAAFLSNVLSLATSLFVMVVYDRVLPNRSSESLLALALGVMLAIVFDIILRSAREGLVENATSRADARVSEDLFDQFVAVSNTEGRKSVGALAMIMRDFEVYRDFMSTAMILTLVDLPFVVIFIAVIAAISGPLFLVPLIALPTVLILVLMVQPAIARSAKESSRNGQTRQGLLVEVLSGLDALRVTGSYAMMKHRFLSQGRLHTRSTQKSRRYHQLVGTVIGLVQQIAQVAVIVAGFYLFVAQEITMGAIIAAVILTGRVMGPVARLGQTVGRANMALVAWRNLRDFLGQTRPVATPAGAGLAQTGKRPPAVELSNVTLRLAEGAPALFSGLNLRIEPGERVAIVGRTGAGKSTLLRLINGLATPEAGAVLIDGAPAGSIPRAEMHRRVGTVFQQPWLVSGTVYDNIALGHPDVSEQRAREALAMAGLGGAQDSDRQSSMLSVPVADQGANLSGGERQAVALARAFAFDPPIYLLDEPSSMMDTLFENRLIEQVRDRLKDQTFVIVTHKARILELCDRVVMLDKGQIVQDLPMKDYLTAIGSGQAAAKARGLRTRLKPIDTPRASDKTDAGPASGSVKG